MKSHYEQACRDSTFAASADPRNPPKTLDEAIRLCDGIEGPQNKMIAKAAVYACFARAFDKAIKEAA